MLTYAVARLILAVGLVAALGLKGRGAWAWVGQAISDVACVTFILAYADGAARAALGWLAAPLVLYVLVWEIAAVTGNASNAEAESPFQAFVGAWRWAWAILAVAPPLAAGGFLVFDLYAPNEWPFPDRIGKPGFTCGPATVHPRDSVVLAMDGGHGEELGVFTPDGTFLYLLTAGGRDEILRLRRTKRLAIDVAQARGALQPGGGRQPVFTRPGKYTFRWSEPIELSASQVCTVRYLP